MMIWVDPGEAVLHITVPPKQEVEKQHDCDTEEC